MSIINLFSKRQKIQKGDVPDVYIYDDVPEMLRVQIVHIWLEALGDDFQYTFNDTIKKTYKDIVDILCREYGLFRLPTAKKHGDRMYLEELVNYLVETNDIEKQLDIIELSFKFIDSVTRTHTYLNRYDSSKIANNAINELNTRFKEHGVGFQFEEGEIVRIDSELIHIEAVKPALRLLNENNYKGAQQEFLSAHEHYRHGRYKESLNDCLKSFESTMKAICDKHEWEYKPRDTAKPLINICLNKGLVPAFWQDNLHSLDKLLESSIPTGRNKLSGHGQGTTPVVVPDYLVAYMLHMTASTLVFLTTAEKNLIEST